MAPNSSDGETKEASLIQLQPTEAMETSNTNTSESEGDRESVDEEEEDDSDSDWDKDSFDGRVYNPSDDDGDYDGDEEFEKMVRSYHRLVIETKGFFEPSDNLPPIIWAGISTIWDLEEELRGGITARDFLKEMASLCVEKHNRREQKKVKLEKILWAKFQPRGENKVLHYLFCKRI